MFDIQMFGANDTITSSNTLDIIGGFADGDTRTFKIPNPRSDLTSSDIESLDAWIAANNVIVGDRTGASSTGINSATLVETTKTRLDLT